MKEIRIMYSRDQWDALVDHCLYNLPYGGLEMGEGEYIEAEMLKLGYKKGEYRYIRSDDAKYEHVCEITGIR